MAATKTWKQLYNEQNTGAKQAQTTPTTDVGSAPKVDVAALSKPSAVQSINPAGITQSYYTTPTNSSNYESGRPVYQQSQALKDAAAAFQQQQNAKPGEYQSQWGDKIQEMINGALNRPAFSYDWSEDPMYQFYAEQYQRNAEMAMDNAMAQSAQLTGGYGNSYAQQVGQQTYQQTMEDLYGMLPELRDAAYQMYQDEGDTMRQNLAMLQGQDETDYGRYRDTVGDWRADLDMIYQMYGDMSDDEYNRYINDQNAWETDRAYWYQKAYDEQQQANWEREFAAKYGGGSSGGGGGGGGSRKKDDKKEEEKTTSSSGGAGSYTTPRQRTKVMIY